jgi:hypothetical protein
VGLGKFLLCVLNIPGPVQVRVAGQVSARRFYHVLARRKVLLGQSVVSTVQGPDRVRSVAHYLARIYQGSVTRRVLGFELSSNIADSSIYAWHLVPSPMYLSTSLTLSPVHGPTFRLAVGLALSHCQGMAVP